MCEADSLDDKEVYWRGFKTTFGQLKAEGWEITKVKAYVPRTKYTPSYHGWNARSKIYIRHREERLMGRIKFYPETEDTIKQFQLDFLKPDHRVLGRVARWIWDELTEEDVPELLAKLAQLADATNPPKVKPVEDNIHQLKLIA